MNTATEVKNLQTPDDERRMDRGVLEIVNLTGATVARATYLPGWRWSTDVKPMVGTESCQVAHTGVLVSGRFHVRMADGSEFDAGPGDVTALPQGHDAWVVGDEPVVVVDWYGASNYARG